MKTSDGLVIASYVTSGLWRGDNVAPDALSLPNNIQNNDSHFVVFPTMIRYGVGRQSFGSLPNTTSSVLSFKVKRM